MDPIAELVEQIKTSNTQTGELIAQLRESKRQESEDLPTMETLMEQVAPELKRILDERDAAAAAAADDPKGRPGDLDGKGDVPQFDTLSDFCRSLIKGELPEMGFEPVEFKAQVAGTATAGGYAVPDEFVPKILEIPMEKALVRPRATVLPLGSDSAKIPAFNQTSHATNFYGGALGYWIAETAAITESDAALEEVSLSVNGLAALNYQSVRLLMASPLAIDAILTRIFGNVITFMEDQAYIDGAGTTQPQGVIGSDCEVAYSRASATDFTAADAVGMYAKLLGGDDDAVWFINRTVIPKIAAWEDTEGTRIWQPSMREGVPGTILGIPVVLTEKCSALGTKGDVILGNWSYYLVGDLGGLYIDFSKERKFEYAQHGIRLLKFTDGKPWLAHTYTPRKGVALSPFVVLT